MPEHRFDSWESYMYPETIDPFTDVGTLRNKFGERDEFELRALEYNRTQGRQVQLEMGAVPLAATFDGDHLRGIHRHLFQDVYEWAGEYRTVDIFKGGPRGFAEVATGEIERYVSDAHELVTRASWRDLDHEAFAERAAEVFAYVNQAHPFREGNGRTSKIFMNDVARESPWMLEFNRIPPRIWNEASMMSGPDLYAYKPHPESLIPVFKAAAVPSCEDGLLAKEMMLDAFGIHGTPEVVHSDGGPSMTSKTVRTLLSDLGVTASRSRPHVSNDNPYSEALFKTMKYLPVFPERFGSLAAAREFMGRFVHAYNHHHRHTGIGMHTPADVHYRLADAIDRDRDAALEAARAAHPERFGTRAQARPKILDRDLAAWINPPPADEMKLAA